MVKSIKTRRPVIVDYGSGNIRSAVKAFEHVLGEEVISTNKPLDLDNASHIVLPGVGSFADCKNGLLAFPGLVDGLLEHVVEKQKPFLGICLGMHLLADVGFENMKKNGLGWIEGKVAKIKKKNNEQRIPHIGWNEVYFKKDNSLFLNIKPGKDFYFVHSYHFICKSSEHIIGRTPYYGKFISAVKKKNIIGVQFHPEKSQKPGFSFLRNFLKIA
mgnify:CR=1 FL=1